MSKEELNLDYRKAYEVFKDTMREGNYLLSVKSALEKQIPKKPWKPFTTSNNIFACSCNHAVSKGDKYCTVCGQALDWSDTE